jgi:chromosome partitioning protein
MSKTLTIAAINLKGGSCKTSTIVNLGGVLHENGHKPLLIDLDPQKSASQWAIQGGEKFPYPVVSIDVGKDAKRFKAKLDQLIKDHKVDTILFDTPPQLEDEAFISALLCDVVLIPLTPSPLDLWAGQQAISTINEARQERNGMPKVVLVPSRLVPNTVLAKEIKGSLKQFNEPISPAITMRVAVAEAGIAGQTINLYAPGSASHKEFQSLAKFVLTNMRK